MQAYRMTHRVTFQEPVETRDPGTGEVSITWTDVIIGGCSSIPAEVLTGMGREFRSSGVIQAEGSARINTRWFPGLLATWRIIWDGRTFNISGIETDRTARQEWRLTCFEGVNEG